VQPGRRDATTHPLGFHSEKSDYGLRDGIACALCNFILRRVASKKYAETIATLIRSGLLANIKVDGHV
jgi:hypothetical protein